MPKALETYTEFVDTVLDLYPTDPVSWSVSWSWTTSFAGTMDELKAFQETVLREVLTPAYTDNVYRQFNMQHRDEAIRRDWKVLQQKQRDIIARTIQLHNSWNHTKKVPVDVLNTINNELKKLWYVELQKNGERYEFDIDNATYGILSRLVRQLHLLYEDLHLDLWFYHELEWVGAGIERSDAIDVEDWIKEYERTRLLNVATELYKKHQKIFGPPQFKVSEDINLIQYLDFLENKEKFFAYVWQMNDAYACSIGLASNTCHEEWQNARKETSFTFKERIVKDGSRAKDTFLTAWSRLKWLFKRWWTKDGDAARQRMQALTDSYRWTDYPSKDWFWDVFAVEKNYDPAPVRVEMLRKKIDDGRKNRNKKTDAWWETWSRLWNSTSWDTTPKDTEQENAERYPTLEDKLAVLREQQIWQTVQDYQRDVQRYFWSYQDNTIVDQKVASMQNVFYSVLQNQKNMQLEWVFNDVKRTTQRFPLLSSAVYNNMDLLWKKNPVNESEGGWYHAMSKVCELQCSNLNWKICQHIGD